MFQNAWNMFPMVFPRRSCQIWLNSWLEYDCNHTFVHRELHMTRYDYLIISIPTTVVIFAWFCCSDMDINVLHGWLQATVYWIGGLSRFARIARSTQIQWIFSSSTWSIIDSGSKTWVYRSHSSTELPSMGCTWTFPSLMYTSCARVVVEYI
jgi:hypothetical protein